MLYDQISAVGKDQYLLIKKGHKYGVTDARGKWLVPLQYDDLGLREHDFYNDSSSGQLFPIAVKTDD